MGFGFILRSTLVMIQAIAVLLIFTAERPEPIYGAITLSIVHMMKDYLRKRAVFNAITRKELE